MQFGRVTIYKVPKWPRAAQALQVKYSLNQVFGHEDKKAPIQPAVNHLINRASKGSRQEKARPNTVWSRFARWTWALMCHIGSPRRLTTASVTVR